MTEDTPLSDTNTEYSASNVGITAELKKVALLDLKLCAISRDEVAYRLSQLIGRTVTVAQIDSIVAETKPHRFPLDLVPAWVRVTGSRRLLDMVCRASGFFAADETEHGLAEFGRAVIERERLASREASLKASLMGRI